MSKLTATLTFEPTGTSASNQTTWRNRKEMLVVAQELADCTGRTVAAHDQAGRRFAAVAPSPVTPDDPETNRD